MDISDLLKSLANIHPISISLEERLLKSFHDKKVYKGEFILQEGNVCTDLFYLQDGLLRSFHNLDEKEITSRIMSTGHIVISPASFFTQTPATESIEALSDCVVSRLPYHDLQVIYNEFPEFNLHARVITEQYFSKQEQRLYMMRKHDANLKYEFFLEHYAGLQNKVPQKYIASFLGIAPETLSRIRNKLRFT